MEHAMLIGEEVHRLFVYCILLMNECFCCVLLLKVLQYEDTDLPSLLGRIG